MLRELVDVVGAPHVVTDAEVLAPHVVDWTGRFRGHTAAMVRPGSTVEVAGVRHTIEGSDSTTPPELEPLIEELSRWARQTERTNGSSELF